jgi:hypothetical protein
MISQYFTRCIVRLLQPPRLPPNVRITCRFVGISYDSPRANYDEVALTSENITSEHITTLINSGLIHSSATAPSPRPKGVGISYDTDFQKLYAARNIRWVNPLI